MPSHVLAVNGDQHRVTVAGAAAHFQLDQVIPSVIMVIDYSKLPGGGAGGGGGGGGGEALLRRLREAHPDARFSFDLTAGCCTAEGSFPAIRRLGEAVGRALGADANGSALAPGQPAREPAAKPQPDQAGKRGEGAGRPRPPADRTRSDSASSPDFSNFPTAASLRRGGGSGWRNLEGVDDGDPVLLMDTEIYRYIGRFYQPRYRAILSRHRVAAVDMESEGVTSLFLQLEAEEEGESREDEALARAHRDLSDLYRELELQLRKEQFDKSDLTDDPELMRQLVAHLEARFPQINLHQDAGRLYLVGSRDDCSLAKKTVQDLREELLGGKGRRSPADPLGPRPVASAPKADAVKKDHKLAANFSAGRAGSVDHLSAGQGAKAHPSGGDQQHKRHLRSSGADPLTVGQSAKAHPSGSDHLHKRRLRISSADPSPYPDRDAGAKEFALSSREIEADLLLKAIGSSSGLNRLKSPDRAADDAMFTGRSESRGDKSLPAARSSKMTHGPVKPYAFETSAGTLIQLEDLAHKAPPFHSTGTSEAQASRAGLLRRTNSFSGFLHSTPNAGSTNVSWGVSAMATITEEFPVDSMVWEYVKDIHRTLVQRISIQHGVKMIDMPLGELVIVKLTGTDRTGVQMAKKELLSVYMSLIERLTQQYLLYSDLGISDSTKTILDQHWSQLRKHFPDVRFISGEAGVHLLGPREICSQIIDTFKALPRDVALSSAPRLSSKTNASSSVDPEEANVKSKMKHSKGKEDPGQDSPPLEQRMSPKEMKDDVGLENQMDERSQQKMNRHASEKAKKTLPDRFHLPSKAPRESHWSDKEGSSHRTELDARQDSRDQAREGGSAHQRDESSGRRSQGRKSSKNSQENVPRGPATGSEEQEPMCTQSPVEGTIVGNMSYGILNSTLEGHEHDLTLKIIYNIQDGTQQRCDPNPGRPYRGGCFEAFLPNNKQGRKVLQLLTKAFYKGFIFKIISLPSGEEKVTWNNIPHKTSITGGKIRDGYPDSGYLCTALAALQSHGLE
eukprot:gi/632982922/ref/XP_007908393.1/ PREDICTED: uncharacterized protein LOC103189711 [Callorhinchus milii]